MAFVAGAIVGSFVNVVGYRVPAGRSVIAGRSACPACGHPVRARDNVPILGWLMLGGRCRDCGSPIAADYPLIEAACGGGLAALAVSEIVAWRATGSSLPILDRLVMLGEWRWLLGWSAKAAALLTIVAWSLLAHAGHAVTWRTVATAVLIVGGMAAAGSATIPWAGATEAAAVAALLAGTRSMLGTPSASQREAAASSPGAWRWVGVAILAAAGLLGWTAAGPAIADRLVRWFWALSGP
jgi:leader peptidase (prepilin peptidase)/N-methyltransferase